MHERTTEHPIQNASVDLDTPFRHLKLRHPPAPSLLKILIESILDFKTNREAYAVCVPTSIIYPTSLARWTANMNEIIGLVCQLQQVLRIKCSLLSHFQENGKSSSHLFTLKLQNMLNRSGPAQADD